MLFIVALVASLLIWRVSRSRQSSRRIECENQFRNIFVALESYQLLHGHFPTGTQNPTSPIRSEPKGYHHNWIEGLLPQLNFQPLYDQIDFDFGVYAPQNRFIAEQTPGGWTCPASESPSDSNLTSYVGICSSIETPISPQSNGTFIQNRPIAPRELVDGLAYVVVVAEKAERQQTRLASNEQSASTAMINLNGGPWSEGAWNSGTRASLRTLGHRINAEVRMENGLAADELNSAETDQLDDASYYVGGVSSNHAGGAYLLTAAGEIRFYSEQMDQILLRQLGGRADSMDSRVPDSELPSETSDERPQSN